MQQYTTITMFVYFLETFIKMLLIASPSIHWIEPSMHYFDLRVNLSSAYDSPGVFTYAVQNFHFSENDYAQKYVKITYNLSIVYSLNLMLWVFLTVRMSVFVPHSWIPFLFRAPLCRRPLLLLLQDPAH